jgi:hypothetical protein
VALDDAFARAALRLAEATDADREWLLARLPESDRGILSQLVRRIVGGGAEHDGPSETAAAQDVLSDAERCLMGANVEQMTRVLESEPDWAVAVLMSRKRWRWGRGVLSRMPDAQARRVSALTRKAVEVTRPRAAEAIVEAFAKKAIRLFPGLLKAKPFDAAVQEHATAKGAGRSGDTQWAR